MLFKTKDGLQGNVQELKRLLSFKITAKQRFLIERELKILASGERNEQNSAYYLDFRFKDSPNWALMHDLRLEHRGRVAQIDHLLINRFLDIYVLESKSYYYGIKITEDGEFLVWDGKGYQAIESPYEQNQRHIQVLRDCIADRTLGPSRLGFPIPINYRNIVMVSPTAKVLKPAKATFDLTSVIKADALVSTAEREIDKKSIVEAPKLIGCDTLREFGEKLARLHRPGTVDYVAKFGISEQSEPAKAVAFVQESPAPEYAGGTACQECGAAVDKKVVYFCRINKAKFNGQILCRECQQIPAI